MAETLSVLNIDSSIATLNEISQKRMEAEGIGFSAGDTVKLVISVLNENVSEFIKLLKQQHAQVLLGGAEGAAIDLIGAMFNCVRNDGEEDGDYKYRISKQNLTLATANETALRLAILGVEGVDNVAMRPYTHGTGSFSVYVVTRDAIVDEETMAEVNAVIEQMKAYGVRGFAYSPVLVPVEFKARIIFDKSVLDLDQKMVRAQAQQIVRDYISQLQVGSALNPLEIRNRIYNLNTGIFDVQIYQFRVNNRPAIVTNQEAQWNERFSEAAIPDAILVS